MDQLRELGVRQGGVLLVHSSYRAIRPFPQGPLGVIAALRAALGDAGTLVMPAWGDDDDAAYDPATTPVSDSLGIIPQTFASLPGVSRSNQPFAFVAHGPHAERILADPMPSPPHGPQSPVGRANELGGQVLLLGVGHDANTTIHLAEALAEVPYGVEKYCTISVAGTATRVDYVETDHCCSKFAQMDEWLRARGLQREGRVGNGHARLIDACDVISVAREALTREPLVFLCGNELGCAECDLARSSVQ